MRVFLLLLFVALTACRREDVPMSVRRPARVVTTTSAAPPVDLKGKTIEFDAPLKPPVIEGCRTGSAVNEPAGTVATAQKEFTSTQTVYTTVWLKESPPDLIVSVRALGDDGKPAALDSREVKGATIVTLALRPLRPGTYKHETYWGGNVICEETITVVK